MPPGSPLHTYIQAHLKHMSLALHKTGVPVTSNELLYGDKKCCLFYINLTFALLGGGGFEHPPAVFRG